MLARVRLVGSLNRGSGKEIEVVLAEEATLGDLMLELSETYPNLGDVKIAQGILLIVNGVEAGNLGGLSTRLSDGDEVALVPVAHGG